ncbi:neuronal PAS domain-containing protein 4A-like isoform X1 [Neodiprion pinetum]|uniref:neuronal PAS domain-containing protein 4A-like isoform X1 n=2 Tax=Neodiprion pinetum TaxID=441929 RepID=UPI001EE0B828|nr:neuronal PAS domain-containing protein 4A-like isoform X1 [Neodiprion pinetum]XP_046483907.1 neuronal PAS domain-containing protein 4A-like isoform X1 [Neodiprion pinetum]XP_046483908.1 neuronal PAS domain-containing protein 4A-like isoform X1 [Neodiprion pinetum]
MGYLACPNTRIDASKSTKGASKLRRDLINAEIANLRDLLPLPASTRQRLSQLQLMALVCVFLRKANYFQRALKPNTSESSNIPMPNIGFSKAMSGFIMMMTQQGKLLYISENATEYLGHSMEDLLIHGDSIYDVIDKQDHVVVQNQLSRNVAGNNNRRLFLCRINVSRNTRRQLRFGDQKVVLVEGRYLPFVPLCNRGDSVFLASCTPVVLPETRESVVQGATNIFSTIHSMDMKYIHIDKTAESHMEYSRSELVGISWYNLLHWDSIRTAHCKHQTVIQSDQERSSTALLRLQSRSGKWFWVHCVLQVKDTTEECQHPVIVCTNQVLSDSEADVMRASLWLYQYASQTKFSYGPAPELQSRPILSYNNYDYNLRRNLVTSYNSSCGTANGIEEAHCVEKSDLEYTLTTKKKQLQQQQQQQQQPQQQLHASTHSSTHISRETSEPVDMSINGAVISHHTGDIEQRTLHILSQALTFNIRNNKQRKGSSTLLQQQMHHGNSVPGVSSTILRECSSPRCSPKYVSLTDLDKSYGDSTEVTSIVASACCTATAIDSCSYNSQRRLVIKTATIVEPAEVCTEPWGSACTSVGNAWVDTLQKVPDIVQLQELSPCVTTPTTPCTDVSADSDLRSGTPIFNFDWSAEHHVPSLKVNFRNITSHESKRTLVQPCEVSQPAITLQLPATRRKHTGASSDVTKGFTK